MPVIEAHELTKIYRVYRKPRDWLVERLTLGRVDRARKICALDKVSVTLDQGRTLGIIGPNGAGKSTLLKVLTGLVRPTSGRLKVSGQVMSFLELGSGFHPEFTGRQNVKLNCAILGLSPKEAAGRAEEIIAFSELGEAIDDPVRTWSAGMFMRLGFSVAAAFAPDVLVVDEVLSVGDEYFMGKCLERINRFKAEGRTIVMVSHDLSLIRYLCDEVVLLIKGKIVASGPSDDVADAYLDSVYETAITSMKSLTVDGAVPQSGVRRGSGEMRILRSELQDENGNPTTALETGKPFKVRFEYRADQPIHKTLFGLNIFRSDGVLLVSTNHILGPGAAEAPPFESGESGEVTFECDNLPLLKGHYSLGVNIFHGDSPMPLPIDEVLGAVKFEVLQGRFRDKGTLVLPGRWSFKKGVDSGQRTVDS